MKEELKEIHSVTLKLPLRPLCDRVYATCVPDLPTLRDRIRDVIASVTPDMSDRTWQEITYRLDIIRATSGSHVEVY
jgi:hypothetical protein